MNDIESSSADESTEPVILPWHEPGERETKDIVATAVIALLLALAAVGFFNAARGVPGSQLGSAVMALLLAVVAVLSWYGPFGTVGLRTSVDHNGLHVRHQGWRLPGSDLRIELSTRRHLPAHQIGAVELVTEEKRRRMWTKSMALGYGGRRQGWTRTTVDRETTEAVFIEQVGAGLRRPWWLLRCNDCAGLVSALELARTQATSSGG